jgi:hypothetical protein
MRKLLGYFLVTAAAALAQPTPTGIVKNGTILLLRIEAKTFNGAVAIDDTTSDAVAGGFTSIDYSKWQYSQPSGTTTTIGPCIVSVTPQPAPMSPDNTALFNYLDAGPVLNLKGPNGSMQEPSLFGAFYYGTLGGGPTGPPAPPPLYLDPGTYTLDNGAGGADIGPFTATLTIPSSPFVWTNADADLSIVRSAGVDIAWTGGDPTTKVVIQGSQSSNDPATFKPTAFGFFICTVDNTGDFFVTPDVLSLLPTDTLSIGGNLMVTSSVQATFNAAGSDMSTFLFQSSASRNVAYK